MKKVSIKTVDGSRFDYEDRDGRFDNLEEELECNSFLIFPVEGGRKFFNIYQIVSISEKEVDNG